MNQLYCHDIPYQEWSTVASNFHDWINNLNAVVELLPRPLIENCRYFYRQSKTSKDRNTPIKTKWGSVQSRIDVFDKK